MSSYKTRNRKFKNKNSKKNDKIEQRKKNTTTASFQAKISWERLRKRENKKKSFQRVPTRSVIEN